MTEDPKKRLAKQRRHRLKKWEQGLCTYGGCRARSDPDRVYCGRHRELIRLKSAAYRKKEKT